MNAGDCISNLPQPGTPRLSGLIRRVPLPEDLAFLVPQTSRRELGGQVHCQEVVHYLPRIPRSLVISSSEAGSETSIPRDSGDGAGATSSLCQPSMPVLGWSRRSEIPWF